MRGIFFGASAQEIGSGKRAAYGPRPDAPWQDLTRPEQHAPQAEAHAPQAEAHAPQAEAQEPQVKANAPQAEAHEPQAEAHAPQAEAHEPQAEAHEPQAEAHEPQAEAHEPQAESVRPRWDVRGFGFNSFYLRGFVRASLDFRCAGTPHRPLFLMSCLAIEQILKKFKKFLSFLKTRISITVLTRFGADGMRA